MNDLIFPKALVTAARTFAKKPAVVGEVLVALVAAQGNACAPQEGRLTDVQRYILAECREEIAGREARREAAAERKRTQRAKGGR